MTTGVTKMKNVQKFTYLGTQDGKCDRPKSEGVLGDRNMPFKH